MERKSIISNFSFNSLLSIVNIIFPIITYPLISEKLGAINIGKVNFSTSLINWVVLIASIGIPVYGIREIARVRDNKEELNKVFSELMVIKLLITVITYLIFGIALLFYNKLRQDLLLNMVASVTLLMNVFAMDWFFQGIEKYKFITSRSIVIKVISLAMILLFIKSKQDYIIYCAILVFGTSFNNLINYMYSRKFVKLTFKNINLLRHVGRLKYLFLASVICSIYTQFDTVILGVVSTEKDVAFYSRNKQILTLCLTIPTALVQVLLPRLSFLYQNEKDRYANELKEYMNVILLIVIPLACIMGLLSEDISVFLGHEEFRQSYYGLMIISPLMIINSISGAQYSLILLPTGNENKSYQYHIIAAISSLLGTMLLGRHLGYIGACVSYLVSQLLAYMYNLFICNKVIKMKAVNSSMLKIAFSCIAPLLLLYLIKIRLSSMLLSIVVKTCCYLIIYMIILFITKEKTILYLISKMRTLVLGEKKAEY